MIKLNSFFATSVVMENPVPDVVDIRVLLRVYDAANRNEALGLAVSSAFIDLPQHQMLSAEVLLVPERPSREPVIPAVSADMSSELDTALNHIYYLLKMMNVPKLDQPQRMVQAAKFFNKHRNALGPAF